MMLTTPAASQNKAFPLAGSLNRLSLSESHTNPIISGQLKKTLWVTFGYSQTSRNSPVRRNLLIKLDCAEMEQSANSLILAQPCRAESGANSLILSKTSVRGSREIKGEKCSGSVKPDNYSGSPEHYRYSGSVVIQNGCIYENQQVKSKEKGSAENTTLEMVPLLIHEENQRSPELDCKINHDSSNLSYEENQQAPTLDDGDNQYIRTCEIFVGHRVTVSKPVQPSGASLVFLRWRRLISLCATSTMALILSPAFVPISSIRASASSALLRLDSNLFSSLSLSWRRAISPCIAVTIKPALLSPSIFTASIPSITSCGMRMDICFDLSLTVFVAMFSTLNKTCDSVYMKSNHTKHLKCDSFDCNLNHTLSTDKAQAVHKITKPSSALTLTGPLTTNDRLSIEVAMLNHTPTRFKFLFLAVCRSDLNAKPHRESVTAHSEQDARRSLAGQFVLSFAGRLPEVNHA